VLSVRDREVRSCCTRTIPASVTPQTDHARKKDYIHFVEGVIADAQKQRGTKGTVTRAPPHSRCWDDHWIYQWYKRRAVSRLKPDSAIH